MTPYQFGRFVAVTFLKTAAGVYPNTGRNEFDDDLNEEIAEVRRAGNTVPQTPMNSGVPGVALSAGRTVNGRPAPVVPGRAGLPPQTRPPAPVKTAPVRPRPPVPAARRLPALPKGPAASPDLGGSFD